MGGGTTGWPRATVGCGLSSWAHYASSTSATRPRVSSTLLFPLPGAIAWSTSRSPSNNHLSTPLCFRLEWVREHVRENHLETRAKFAPILLHFNSFLTLFFFSFVSSSIFLSAFFSLGENPWKSNRRLYDDRGFFVGLSRRTWIIVVAREKKDQSVCGRSREMDFERARIRRS